jgi:hypothetical protein
MKCYPEDPTRHATLLVELENRVTKGNDMHPTTLLEAHNVVQRWKTTPPRSIEFGTNYQLMLLKIMENVRRVAVLGSKTAEVILSRVAVLESETAEVILSRLAVLEPEIAKVIFATAVVVKFRITSPDPSAWSFAENVISAAEMELKARLLML